jgi:hypothetical protein
MARLGIASHVADKVLNHQSGTISSVAAVYQRHDFLSEHKEALERWGAHIEHLLDIPAPSPRMGCLPGGNIGSYRTVGAGSRMKRRLSDLTIANQPLPDGFLRVSDAIDSVAAGMWGRVPRALTVQAIKRIESKLSVWYGPWREEAGRQLRKTSLKGGLTLFLVGASQMGLKRCSSSKSVRTNEPIALSVDVLKRLITTRGYFPDHPIRCTMKAAGGDSKLLALLTDGTLAFRTRDFEAWYVRERAKGRWPSQQTRRRAGVGRPANRSAGVRNAVVRLALEGTWTAKQDIAELRRLLIESGRTDVPSPDTLARLVDRLHRETGNPDLRRVRRRRRENTEPASIGLVTAKLDLAAT